MDTETYPSAAVRAELESWIFATVDMSVERGAAEALGVAAVPVAIALGPDGRELGRFEGFLPAGDLAARLRRARLEGR